MSDLASCLYCFSVTFVASLIRALASTIYYPSVASVSKAFYYSFWILAYISAYASAA